MKPKLNLVQKVKKWVPTLGLIAATLTPACRDARSIETETGTRICDTFVNHSFDEGLDPEQWKTSRRHIVENEAGVLKVGGRYMCPNFIASADTYAVSEPTIIEVRWKIDDVYVSQINIGLRSGLPSDLYSELHKHFIGFSLQPTTKEIYPGIAADSEYTHARTPFQATDWHTTKAIISPDTVNFYIDDELVHTTENTIPKGVELRLSVHYSTDSDNDLKHLHIDYMSIEQPCDLKEFIEL